MTKTSFLGSNPFWVSLQIKATGGLCNLGCRYCINRNSRELTFMSDDVLKATVQKALYHNRDMAVFCWFGGEPTLARQGFYEKAVAYQKEYSSPSARIVNQIQTNGTLITLELATFFRENSFGVGVSIDGPEEIHNKMRVIKSGRGSYHLAVRGLRLLQDAGVNPSVIVTVSKETLPFARQVFRHVVELGIRRLSYSPVLDSAVGEYPSITNDEWYGYIRQVFDEWCRLGDPEIEVRELNEVIAWVSQVSEPCCSSLGTCSHWFLVDHDGDIYPCEKWGKSIKFGNVLTHDFSEIIKNSTHRRFARLTSYKPEKCQRCRFLSVCNNGCTQMRVIGGEFDILGLYAFCQQRKALFRDVESAFSRAIP